MNYMMQALYTDGTDDVYTVEANNSLEAMLTICDQVALVCDIDGKRASRITSTLIDADEPFVLVATPEGEHCWDIRAMELIDAAKAKKVD